MNLADFIALILIAATLMGAALFLVLEIYVVIIGRLKGAPFIRSGRRQMEIMFDLAEIKPGDVVLDLGSGDGSFLIEAARLKARAMGIEINPFLCLYSRWRARRAGLDKLITIVCGDFWKYPLGKADVLFLYLWPSVMEKLREKLERELKPGSRVVSNGFPIPGWKHIIEKEKVYLYKK